MDFGLGGLGGMFGGGGGGNSGGFPMGGIIPTLLNGQGMGFLQMLQNQGQNGQAQSPEANAGQQPASWLNSYGGGGFLGGRTPTLASFLQGRR